MKPGYEGPAIDAVGLVKEFERGRRTTWQRFRRQADQRERFRAVDGIDLRVERGESDVEEATRRLSGTTDGAGSDE